MHELSKVSVLWGEGPQNPPLLALGSVLGQDEEEKGRVFIGPTGQYLTGCLHEAGLQRSDVYLTNAIKCRPINPNSGKQRAVTTTELDLCQSWLDQEIQQVNPKVIIAMGKEAAYAACKFNGSILEKRGRVVWSDRYQRWVILTLHPAYVVRKQTERLFLVLDLIKARRLAYEGGFTPSPVNYIVVDALDKLYEMRKRILSSEEVAYDWETTGLHPLKSWGFCISFSVEENTAYVVPRFQQHLQPFWASDQLPIVDDVLREILLSDVGKIGHNLPFDNNVTRTTLGIWPNNIIFDTMMAHHLLNNHLGQRAHGLKVMADLYTDMGLYDVELDDWLVNNKTPHLFYEAPNEMLWKYSGADSDATLRLKHVLDKKLDWRPGIRQVFVEERMPLVLTQQEEDREGVRIDQVYLNKLSGELSETLERITKEVIETLPVGLVSEEFNPNSHPQKRDLLFNKLKLPVLGRTENSWEPSTAKEFLEPISHLHPCIPLLLEHAAYTKIKGTYVDGKEGDGGIKVAIDEDGRARVNTILVGTETFRLATQKPFPVHTWPRNKKGRPSVRSLVIPDDGYVLNIADYKQQEYVIQALAAKQEDMIVALLDRQEDAHEYTMEWLHQVKKTDFVYPHGVEPDDEIKKIHNNALRFIDGVWEKYPGGFDDFKNLRSETKQTNFGIMYREGHRKLAKTLKVKEALWWYCSHKPCSRVFQDVPLNITLDICPACSNKTIHKGYWRPMTEEEAANVIERWYERNHMVRAWQNGIVKELRKTGYVTGLFDTYRYLPQIFDDNIWAQYEAERAACNFPIQNAGAHVMLRAKIRIHYRLKQYRDPQTRVYFSQHDSIVVHCPERWAEEIREGVMREEMERPYDQLRDHLGNPRFIYTDRTTEKVWV